MQQALEFDIPDIHCKKCAAKIQQALESISGVESTELSVQQKHAKIVIDTLKTNGSKIKAMMLALGFTAMIN